MGGVRNNNRADAPPTRDQRVQIGQSRGNARDLRRLLSLYVATWPKASGSAADAGSRMFSSAFAKATARHFALQSGSRGA